ncbi:AtpZ/AtpI family protein [Candidatus Obscuribacterales bacterium]|nr:AtpZ/AtpI family protein [Candidatus Obscuribacterales bacterium]
MKDENTSKERQTDGSKSPEPPTKTPEERARENVNMIAASQFAYTLTIGTVLFGFVGMWLGNKLGGAPWNILLMLLLGGMAFAGEVYRMYIMFTPKKPKKPEGDGKGGGKNQGGDKKDGKDDA